MNNTIFLLILYFCILPLSSKSQEDDLVLEQVQILLRHGDRTAYDLVNFPIGLRDAEVFEIFGYGKLTNIGKLRMFENGQLLRQRYENFIQSINIIEDVFAQSSFEDRAKTSLQLVLAGLFPPNSKTLWNQYLTWQPIPIFSLPKYLDYLFHNRHCIRYENEMNKLFYSPEAQSYLAKYDKFFQYLTKLLNRPVDLIADVWGLRGVLEAQESLGILPTWYDAEFSQDLKQLSINLRKIQALSAELLKLDGGPLVKKFIENLNLDETKKNVQKFHVYLGHNHNIITVFNSLGITLSEMPSYGSGLILEKIRSKTSQEIFVRIIEFSSYFKRFYIMTPAGCSSLCPSKRLLNLVKPIIPSDKDLLCQIGNWNFTNILDYLQPIND